jgi:hypothetical protein
MVNFSKWLLGSVGDWTLGLSDEEMVEVHREALDINQASLQYRKDATMCGLNGDDLQAYVDRKLDEQYPDRDSNQLWRESRGE